MTPSATVLRNRLTARARIRQLQVFVRVAELGSATKAGLALGLTQPAVTQALADLEGLIECALFIRHARGMLITDVGETLLQVARKILAAVDEGADRLAISMNAADQLRIVAIPGALGGILARAIARFTDSHPEVMLYVEEAAHPRAQAVLLARSDIDIALCHSPAVIPAGWEFAPLVPDPFIVVGGRQHPLGRRSSVSIEQLKKATWIVAPFGTGARAAFDRLFEHEDAVPQTLRLSTSEPDLYRALLQHKPLLAYLSLSFIDADIQAGRLVEIRHRAAAAQRHIGLLARTGGLSDVAQRFAACLQECATPETIS